MFRNIFFFFQVIEQHKAKNRSFHEINETRASSSIDGEAVVKEETNVPLNFDTWLANKQKVKQQELKRQRLKTENKEKSEEK
jgi:hypothetical protein